MLLHISPKLFDLLTSISFFCFEKRFHHRHLKVDDFERRLKNIQELKELLMSSAALARALHPFSQ
jgi:hypothetical protein